jgi:hypothetical protein
LAAAAADYRQLFWRDVEMDEAPHDIGEVKITVKFPPFSGAA